MKFTKASVLLGPRSLTIREFKRSKLDKNILLRVDAAGVCGTDPHIYEGEMGTSQCPVILGHEISGTIEAIGENSRINSFETLKVGDRVAVTPGTPCKKCYYCKMFPHMENYCTNRKTLGSNMSCNKAPHLFGGFAESVIIPEDFWLHKIPKKVSSEVGALAEPLAVAVRAVGRLSSPGIPYAQLGFGIGNSVLVQGAGTIGLLTAICAKLSGADVTIVDKIALRLEIARKFGIVNQINISGKSDEELLSIIKEMHNGVGPDAVIEATGELEAVSLGLQMVRRGGRYVELGHFADIGEIRVKPSLICRNDLEFVGSVLGSPQDYRRAMYILSDSKLPFHKIITHRFSLEDTEKAILNTKSRKGLKSMVIPNGEINV